jgi:hypothetical protein
MSWKQITRGLFKVSAAPRVHAALDVVWDAATSAIPKKYRKGKDENPRKGGAVR